MSHEDLTGARCITEFEKDDYMKRYKKRTGDATAVGSTPHIDIELGSPNPKEEPWWIELLDC